MQVRSKQNIIKGKRPLQKHNRQSVSQYQNSEINRNQPSFTSASDYTQASSKKIANYPIRAKRLPLRQESQKKEMATRCLRDKRLEKSQIPAQRLQKVLAFSGLGPRRDMENLIKENRVIVNGQIAQLGSKVTALDKIFIDNKRVYIKWPDRLPRIILYHKIAGELVSKYDPKGRPTVFDRLPQLQGSQWVAVGRLDYNTSGLLILTNSGELANRMLHPRFRVEREYAIRLIGPLTEEQQRYLTQESGIMLEDGPAKFERLAPLGGNKLNRWYQAVICEGRNREIRRIFAHMNVTVSRLIRTRFGMLSMPPRLKQGQFHELNATEVLTVLNWAGLQSNGMRSSPLS